MSVGDTVMVQDQSSNKAGKWTKTGKVIESLGFDSYLVKIDGSRTVSKRNRKFLKKITPYADVIKEAENSTGGKSVKPNPSMNDYEVVMSKPTLIKLRKK